MSKLVSKNGPPYLFFIKRSSLFSIVSACFRELCVLVSASSCGRLELALCNWQAGMSPEVPEETQNNMQVSGTGLHQLFVNPL